MIISSVDFLFFIFSCLFLLSGRKSDEEDFSISKGGWFSSCGGLGGGGGGGGCVVKEWEVRDFTDTSTLCSCGVLAIACFRLLRTAVVVQCVCIVSVSYTHLTLPTKTLV